MDSICDCEKVEDRIEEFVNTLSPAAKGSSRITKSLLRVRAQFLLLLPGCICIHCKGKIFDALVERAKEIF